MVNKTRASSRVYTLPLIEHSMGFHPVTKVKQSDTIFDDSLSLIANSDRTTESQTPGWRRRIQRGDNATTRLSGSLRRFRVLTPGYIYRYAVRTPPFADLNDVSTEITGNLFSPNFGLWSTIEASTISSSNDLARAGFVKVALKTQHQMQSLVTVGELAETIRMLRSPGAALRKRLREYIRRARQIAKKRWSKPRRHRALRDTWLEANFGWAPFVSDIEDARKAYSKLGEYRPFKYIRFPADVEKVVSDVGRAYTSHNAGIRVEAREQHRHFVATEYRGVVDLQVDGLGFRLASQNFGFDWQNFAPTIWELVPYSFLVDYFTNIGDMIAAAALNTTRLRWVSKTTKQLRETRFYGHVINNVVNVQGFEESPVAYSAITEQQYRPDQCHYQSETVLRETYTGSLISDIHLEIPGFLSDAKKWLNMAALFRYGKK